VGRVAQLLLPSWPGSLTLSDALSRFEAARDRLSAGEPTGWSALRRFAERAAEPMPAAAILEAIKAFLPEKAPVAVAKQRSGFSAVTLTTVRRAAGVAWSHVILCGSNQGVWPTRHEPSCWLGDDTRMSLNESAGLALGLSTADADAANERRLYAAVARDTLSEVIFSAALFDEEDAEAGLGPNPWLERILWNAGLLTKDDSSVALRKIAGPGRPARIATGNEPAALEAWGRIWFGRRDPRLAFDQHFFSLGDGRPEPRLSAVLVEKGLEDPVRLWFGAILKVERVEWRPYTRARPKLVGTAVHGVLKRALQGLPAEGDFFAMPARPEAEARLSSELEALRLKWPDDRYWDSLHVDVSGAARDLLDQVYSDPLPGFAAAEVRMPEGSALQLGPDLRVAVSGRMDLVTADRPSWRGSTVTIIDFKTGADLPVTARRMANSGASLQLGVYLEAARSAGATGSVKMLKPGTKPSGIATGQLADALVRLGRLGEHLSTGIFGALTPDRGDFETRFDWPLACAPIGHALLQEKYALTFTGGDDVDGGDPGDE
jgi:hypothetical protein